MRVLMIGGSGILSTDVCKLAIERNLEVYLLNRGTRKYALQKEANLIVSDIVKESVDTVRDKLNGIYFDVVVDFLAFKPDDINKHLNIIKGLCNQYIFISSATAYEKCEGNDFITESTPIGNERWDYAYNKALCEKYLSENCMRFCKHWTVVRPYVTYNETRIPYAIIPGHANWTLVNRMLQKKPIVIWDEGKAKCTITHSKDFAVGVVGLYNNNNAYEQAFHVTSDFVMNWKEVIDEVINAVGVNADVVSLSTSYIINVLPEYAGVLLGDKGTDMVFDNSKIKNAVPEFEGKISFRKGIRNTIKYYFNHKELQVVDYKWEGRVDYLLYRYYKETNLPIKSTLNIKNYTDVTLKNKIDYFCYRHNLVYSLIQLFYSIRRTVYRPIKKFKSKS